MRALLILLILAGCTSVPDIEGVTYWISTNCHKDHPRGYWWPGKICYDGTDEVKAHENCHELAYRGGLSRKENIQRCH